MALFSKSEASACTIWRTEQHGDKWIVGAQDGNRLYFVTLEGLGDNPDTNVINNAVIEELVKTEKLAQLANVVETKYKNGNPI